jgi:hypothetical protein
MVAMRTEKVSNLVTHVRAFCLVICIEVLAGAGVGQTNQGQPAVLPRTENSAKVQDAITSVKSGQVFPSDIETIAEADAIEAIPLLEEQFAKSQDSSTKMKIADALVRLRDKDDKYWDFLVRGVTPAIEDDAPFVLSYDENGKSRNTSPSPDFLDWAATHHVSVSEAAANQMYNYPGAIMDIGMTGDPRAVPILRRALLSRNFLIEAEAARGLAKLQDKDSIPLIIEACNRAPLEAATAIALPLVYFDDAEAQRAVDLYVPRDLAADARKTRAGGDGPYGERLLPR